MIRSVSNFGSSPNAPKLKRFAATPGPSAYTHHADPPCSQPMDESDAVEYPTSTCGTGVKRLQVKKEGPNTGKWFYSCSCIGKNTAFVWESKSRPGFVMKCRVDSTPSDGYVFHIKSERELEIDSRIETLECQLIDLKNRFDNLIAELSA